MSWEGTLIGLVIAALVFVCTLIACTAVDFHRWVWHTRHPKVRRALADWCEEMTTMQEPMQKPAGPPNEEVSKSGTVQEKRHHPALKGPGELKDVPTEANVGQVAEKPGEHVGWWVVPGRWGGPYL